MRQVTGSDQENGRSGSVALIDFLVLLRPWPTLRGVLDQIHDGKRDRQTAMELD